MRRERKPELTRDEARKDHGDMLRFLLLHALVGTLLGMLTAAAVIWFNIGGLGTLIGNSANPVIPVLLIVVPFGSIFGGAATASAILLMPYEKKYKD